MRPRRYEPSPGRPLVLPGSRGVFVSFRPGDSDAVAARLADRLARRLPRGPIILGPAADRAGTDATHAVAGVIDQCVVLLAVIGRHWLDDDDSPDTSLLRAPDDRVRLEVATALSRGIPVIPVLVDGAAMPTADQLPDALAGLAGQRAVRLRQLTFRQDSLRLTAVVELRLNAAIERVLPAAAAVISPQRRLRVGRRRVLIGVGSLLILAVLAVISYRIARGPVPDPGAQPAQISTTTTRSDATIASAGTASLTGLSTIGSSPAAPLLDEPTVVWFGTICGGQRDLQKFATPVIGGSLSAAKTAIVTAYTNLSDSAARTSVVLTSLPVPAVPDGVGYRTSRISQFTAIAEGYRTAAATISGFAPTSADALKAKIDAVEAAVKVAVTKSLAGANPLPAQYQIAVQQLPACAGVTG